MPDDMDDDRPRPARRVRREEDDFDEEEDDRPRRRRQRDDEDDRDATGGIIPYKNGMALASYYCGVFSLIPGLGCALGIVAVVLGIMGIAHANKHPKARGKGHAITGIILGIFGPFIVIGGLAILSVVLAK